MSYTTSNCCGFRGQYLHRRSRTRTRRTIELTTVVADFRKRNRRLYSPAMRGYRFLRFFKAIPWEWHCNWLLAEVDGRRGRAFMGAPRHPNPPAPPPPCPAKLCLGRRSRCGWHDWSVRWAVATAIPSWRLRTAISRSRDSSIPRSTSKQPPAAACCSRLRGRLPPEISARLAFCRARADPVPKHPICSAPLGCDRLEALGARLFARCGHIHFEDGFGPDEIERRFKRRAAMRRLALGGARRVVVPSRTLETIALGEWHLAPEHVRGIPNSIDADAFVETSKAPRTFFARNCR